MKSKRKLKILSLLLALCMAVCSLPITALAAHENTHKNTNDALSDILKIAATQIGYTEEENGYTKYGAAFGDGTMDWCCAFVSWCALEAEISVNAIPQKTSCTDMQNAFISKKLYVSSISQGSTYIPQAGDLVFFAHSSSKDAPDHIGIVEKADNEKITVIEGNYSNKVARTTYKTDSKKIVGFATPDYLNGRTTYKTGTYQTNVYMNFRSSPDTSASIICVIPSSTNLEITEINGNWGYTCYDGKFGWILLEYSTFLAEQVREVDWLMVDVSKWQHPESIDWNKLKKQGVKAVIIRIGGRGYGSERTLYADEKFAEHYKNAKAAGLHVGAYFFSYALTKAEAQQEAQLTLELLSQGNYELDMPVFIDIEDYVESNASDNQHIKAGRDVCSMVVNTFCDIIEDAGYYPGVYCNKSFAQDLLYPSVFEDRAVWIAHYGVTQCGYQGQFDIWQYTRYGKLDGYSGYLDLNHCYIDFPSRIKEMQEENAQYGKHTPSEWKIKTKATCSTTGEKVLECTDCGVTLKTQLIPCTNHLNSIQGVIWKDTSILPGVTLNDDQLFSIKTEGEDLYQAVLYLYETEGGSLVTYCTDCNKVLSVKHYYVNGCGHEAVSKKTTNASCSKDGMIKNVCKDCKEILSAELIAKVGHTQGAEKITKKATCTKAGLSSISCTKCKAVISTSHIDKTEHSFGEWEVLSQESLETDGKYIRYCTACNKSEEKTVNKVSLGDINEDGFIKSDDARLALRFAVQLEKADERQTLAADINNDGTVNSADARMILRTAVKLENIEDLYELYFVKQATE
ncbi:MAG: CHAP domain-containing protein [Clostridia bacterium]|nr:CHAP domain-containing protein [Clostridia bacterium]